MHGDEELTRKDILQTVTRIIGPIAKPDKIQFVTGLPKTRSGKIMRRILRKIAEGETANLGDTTTLLDPGVVEEIRKGKFSNVYHANCDCHCYQIIKQPDVLL